MKETPGGKLPLMFGRSEIHPNCRSFLMTVLTHQAGWETVENLINLFLREFDSAYDPASVLDLISATNSNPKLWQGVDKYVPRHQPDISPFRLAEDQLLVMAEYIVEEISQLEMKSTKFSITNLLGPTQPTVPKSTKAVRNGLQERAKLWLQCCQQEKDVVDHVISNLMEKKGKNPCAKKMVSQVYLEFPEIIFVENWASKAEELNFTEEEITCVLDTVSHSLITAISNTQPGKDWSKKASHEIEICLRKLAAVHPTLLVRQLPLMGTLLEGRVHLEFSAFHQQNHHIPFVVYLGLLDLMQPHVLKHFQFLKAPFILYFKLFQNYGHMKDYSSSLSRFSVLLHNLLSANPKEVKEYLSPYYNTLRELSLVKYYIDVYPLQNLLGFLVPPSMVSDLCAATPAQLKNVGVDTQTSGFVSGLADRFLQVSNHDEIIPILQDLEVFSTRNPAALYHFSEHLSPLLNSESDCCRNLAFSLIIKHVTYNPASGSSYLESVLQALQSRNSHVRDTVLERIHEFVVLCQENGEEILLKIFDLGVTANINVLAALRKSLSLLRNYSCLDGNDMNL
ncbi:Integrator complex subunit 1 [Orchesella cincta]|uniref:Integrator complex subunit 1 n=1 Tax=Orchesella cincta TaxID=48709 RepID=A0A1D2MQM3_ORCCI|nr:Integrator complex subunit 1 [Orchesella cincta]